MPVHDELGKRMKTYEYVSRHYLTKRTPVIIRIDMRAGHTFCRGFKRPFDEVFIKSMQETAKCMCENIQNAVLSYQQSDEISIVLVDYEKLDTAAWFDNCQNKVETISASLATMAFNNFFRENVNDFTSYAYEPILGDMISTEREEDRRLADEVYAKKIGLAMFDARAFTLPKEEVTNYFYWRQLDASRNSVQMVGQANFPHKKLQNRNCSQIQDMLMMKKGINWNNFPVYQKRGSCCIKHEFLVEDKDGEQILDESGCPTSTDSDKECGIYRSEWIVDKEIPIFKGEGRDYIEKLINFS